jgi:hypothetical protein
MESILTSSRHSPVFLENTKNVRDYSASHSQLPAAYRCTHAFRIQGYYEERKMVWYQNQDDYTGPAACIKLRLDSTSSGLHVSSQICRLISVGQYQQHLATEMNLIRVLMLLMLDSLNLVHCLLEAAVPLVLRCGSLTRNSFSRYGAEGLSRTNSDEMR